MDTTKESVSSSSSGKKVRMAMALSSQEKIMLDKICERFGCNHSEFFRGLLRDKYAKNFPAYMDRTSKAKVVKPEEFTPEQKCEAIGGKVERRKEGFVCVFRKGESEMTDLLENINKKYKNPFTG